MEQDRLTVVREEPEPCRIKLNIEVAADEVKAVFSDMINTFRKHASLPGFRKGKSPRALVLRRFSKKIVEEAKADIIRQSVQAAIEKEGIEPETRPRVENEEQLQLRETDSFVFAVTFDVTPSFDLPDYRSIEVRGETTTVGESEIDRAIREWLRSRASYDTVDRAARAGDLLKVSYDGKLTDTGDAGDLPETANVLLHAEDTWLALRDPEIIPGIIEAMIGVEANQQRVISVTFPETYFEGSLAGKSAEYVVRVAEVQSEQVPELTDELAQEMGAQSAEGMRETVRARLEADGERRQQEAARSHVLSALMDTVDFPLPPAILASETYTAFMGMLQDEARQGRREEELKESQNEILERARHAARERLKRHYVLRRIAEAEQIKVEAAEVDAYIQVLSLYQRVQPKVLRRRLEKSGRIAEVITQVLERKTVEHIVSTLRGDSSEGTAPEEAQDGDQGEQKE